MIVMNFFFKEQLSEGFEKETQGIFILCTTKFLPDVNDITDLKYLYSCNTGLKQIPSMGSLTPFFYLTIHQNKLRQLPEHAKTYEQIGAYGNPFPKWLDYELLLK